MTAPETDAPIPALASTGDRYVLCEVAGATYAVRSDDIEQLEMVGTLTPVPNAPPFVEGVTAVRGRVIPAVSLRARFGFPRVAPDLRSRLVVVRSGSRSVGLIVDSAREFAAVPPDSVQPTPDALVDDSSHYFRGVAHLGERLILMLDIGELLKTTDTSGHPERSEGSLSEGSRSHVAGALPASM